MGLLLQFTVRELLKVVWFCFVLSAFSLIYLAFLISKKREHYKILREKYGYQMPPLSSSITGHNGMDSLRQVQIDWRNTYGNIHGFYNCDQPCLRISDLNAVEEVFVRQTKVFHRRLWREFRLLMFKDSVLFSHGTKWQTARRLIRQGLHPIVTRKKLISNINGAKEDFPLNNDANESAFTSLVEFVNRFREVVNQPRDKLTEEELAANYKQIDEKLYATVLDEASPTGLAVDLLVYNSMSLLSVDFILRVGFGLDLVNVLDGMNDETFRQVNDWTKNISHPVGAICQAIPAIQPICAILIVMSKPYKEYYKWVSKNITQRYEKLYLGKGMWDKGANSGMEDKPLFVSLYEEYRAKRYSLADLVGNVGPLIVAGTDTTTTTVTNCIWCIAKYEDLQEKLVEDVRQFGVESEYLDMFVKEVLRMYPPLPNFVVRTADRDTVVQGRIVKKGMSVYLGIEALHHDEKIFPDPYKFDPLRFAKGKKYPAGSYAPFGLGNRMCLGYHLAYKEIKRNCVEILKYFSIKLISPLDELQHETSTIFLAKSKQEIRVRLIPRRSEPGIHESSKRGRENVASSDLALVNEPSKEAPSNEKSAVPLITAAV